MHEPKGAVIAKTYRPTIVAGQLRRINPDRALILEVVHLDIVSGNERNGDLTFATFTSAAVAQKSLTFPHPGLLLFECDTCSHLKPSGSR